MLQHDRSSVQVQDFPIAAPARFSGKPRRIALFSGSYNHITDGVTLTLNRLVAYLEQEGAEVMIFAPTVKNPPVRHAGKLVPSVSVRAPFRPEYRITLGLSRKALKQFKEFAPDIVHIATPDLLGFFALKLARKNNIPVVSTYHTHFSSYLKYYKLGMLERYLWKYLVRFYRQCEQIYVPTETIAEELREHGIEDGVRLWERGVETDRFTPRNRSLAWRQEYGLQNSDIAITFVGRLVWEKGLGLFADVVEELQHRGLNFKSIIVGDGPAREELAERLTDTIFTGYQSGHDLATAYASSDIFFFPSDTETFGNVTLEAMASGLPAVCADATGSKALVVHKKTGFLAPPGNTEAFTEYIAQLISHPELRARMGHAARERSQHYAWQNVLSRMTTYYDDLLADRR